MPGRASSARMNSAIRPPIMNHANDGGDVHDAEDLGVRRVQVLQELRTARRRAVTGYGRVTTGRGATAVKVDLQRFGALACPPPVERGAATV